MIKAEIKKATRGRKIARSKQCNYVYQVSMNENYTKDTDQNVLYNVGNRSEKIGYACTKSEFIDLVYNHVNKH
jgi:hypothetical protein